jgi:sucrose synthase
MARENPDDVSKWVVQAMAQPRPTLRRLNSIQERVQSAVEEHRNVILDLLSRYVKQGRTILQPHHLLDELNNVTEADKASEIKDSAFGLLLLNCQVCALF